MEQLLKKKESAVRGEESASIFIAQPLDLLLTSGGDPRLVVDPADNLNGYGCRPAPRPEAISFSSTTASTISDAAYLRVSAARLDLMRAQPSGAAGTAAEESAFDLCIERMREELKKHLLIAPEKAEVVFSPSGTDGQILALFAARAVLGGAKVTSVIVGANETGSGTAFTARGRHFGLRTAQGVAVEKGAGIGELEDGASSVDIPLRDEEGALRAAADMDRAVVDAVGRAVAAGSKVLLQAMDASKLGVRAPSAHCLKDIAARWPNDVLTVIDACQMRLGRKRIKEYLARGYVVLLTGSKFFAGPPFSGALLVPSGVSAALSAVQNVPVGLADYANRADWPLAWRGIRDNLPARQNLGQWLRWEAALEEMRLYFAVSGEKRRAALEDFGAAVARRIENAPSFSLLSAPAADPTDDIDDEEMEVRTVFPFFVQKDGQRLGAEDCRKIYLALNRDISAHLPAEATAEEKKLAARLCHIGQPVAVAAAAVLRVAAGARTVYGGWTEEEVRTVFDKMELILKYFAWLDAEKKSAAEPQPLRLGAQDEHVGQDRIGMAKLTRLAFNNVPLKPLWDDLFRQVEQNPANAAAMMDMADIAQISGLQANGLVVQSGALGMERLYNMPCAAERPRLRVLMLAAGVEMGGNTPIEFLLEGSDIALSVLYIVPGLPLPDPLPYHDIAFNAIADTEDSRAALEIVEALMPRWPRPVLNAPEGIRRLNRDALYALLADAPDIYIPMTARISRAALESLGRGEIALTTLLADGVWPLIVRPIDSHAGRGLDRLESAADIEKYLAGQRGGAFFISRYIDYSGKDGAFRKYRIVFVDGKAYAIHMAISHQWKIWYLNADMAASAEKRAEEDAFMTHFDEGFGVRHKEALAEIAARVGLSYFAIDCAETKDGALLIFEGGNTMIVHNMDSDAVYPYKAPQMKKVYAAFTGMIAAGAEKDRQ